MSFIRIDDLDYLVFQSFECIDIDELSYADPELFP